MLEAGVLAAFPYGAGYFRWQSSNNTETRWYDAYIILMGSIKMKQTPGI
jgi:hypothetical protein